MARAPGPPKTPKGKPGDIYLVPLGDEQFAVIVLARIAKRRRWGSSIVLCYLFEEVEPRDLPANPTLDPKKATDVVKVADAELCSGRWPRVGSVQGFTFEGWPNPEFARVPLWSPHRNESPSCFLSLYDQDDLAKLVSERQVPAEELHAHPAEGLYGSGALEIYLRQLRNKRCRIWSADP